jgi:hypothetical protein
MNIYFIQVLVFINVSGYYLRVVNIACTPILFTVGIKDLFPGSFAISKHLPIVPYYGREV